MALQKDEGRYQIIHRRWTVTGRADEFDAWITQPDADGLFAPVLVCHDVFGVTPQMQEIAKLLSRMGYVAIVPDFYYRAGGLPPEADRDTAEKLAGYFSDGRMLADAFDSISFLQSQLSWVDGDRLGLLGVGMGGRLALLVADRLRTQAQCAICISPVLGDTDLADGAVRDRTAIDVAETEDAPVLAIFGGKDELTDEDELERFREALGQRGAIVTYPAAGRDLVDETAANYDPAVAGDAYGRTIGFLDTYVGHEPRSR